MTNIQHAPATWALIGRSSSHFTRLCRIVALEAGIEHTFQPVYDITALEPGAYGDNPAMKVPVLHHEGQTFFGSEHICRTLAEHTSRRIVGLDKVADVMARNAHELWMQAMQAQVQLVFGLQVAKLPEQSIYFVKAREGLQQVLAWFDEHHETVLKRLPPSDLSVLEAGLYVLFEHIRFRQTLELGFCPRLANFARAFGERPSAQKTPHFVDVPTNGKEIEHYEGHQQGVRS